ncbi:MAG TPA: hypothetical protein VF391_05830 [Dermatophilaceae bacterium]
MRLIKYAAALSGVSMLAGSLCAGPAGATTAGTKSAAAVVSAAGSCGMGIRSVTAAGDLGGATVRASTPPTRVAIPLTGLHVFPAGSARLSTTWEISRGVGSDFLEYGNVVGGPSLYNAAAFFDGIAWHSSTAVVGGGWGSYTAIASSNYSRLADPAFGRHYLYGLRNDGVLFRWTTQGVDIRWDDPVGSNFGARRLGSYPGFSSVKAMTLISQTATYDTFLANLRGGGLYTIRIPVSSPMKVVVKRVRTSTWQVFESLVAEQCGSQSTLLTGIDKDTGSAYLYAVSHATGATTVIQSRGKIPGTFTDPVYFLRHPELNNLNGE